MAHKKVSSMSNNGPPRNYCGALELNLKTCAKGTKLRVYILTEEQAISLDRSEHGLTNYFRTAMKQNRLFEILDNQVVNEGQNEEIFVVAKLTKRCLKLNGKKRPAMKQVEIVLQQLGRFQESFSIQKTRIQEHSLQQQTCQDYCSVSERSHSYTFGPVTEEIVQDDEVLFS